MKNFKLQTPQGTNDYLQDECARKREMENLFRNEFITNGYSEIQTPAFEYYDVFTHDAVPYVQENMIKFFDLNGRILVLRPEMTVPIARVAATKLLQNNDVLKLFYIQNVYGFLDQSMDAQAEVSQAGIEYIGKPGSEADAEVVALAAKTLLLTGLKGFKLELGQVGFFRGLIGDAPITEEQEEKIRNLVDAKNTVELDYELSKMPIEDDLRQKLLALPDLFGDDNSVFDLAYSFAQNEESTRAVDDLKRTYDILCDLDLEKYISVDFGLLNNYKYYSGIIIRGIVDDVGSPILSGGRYDHLLEEFGRPAPATGFALRIKEIMTAINRQNDALGAKAGTLTIALAKGRLAKDAQKYFKKCNVDVSELNEDTRKLILQDKENNIRFLMVKPADVPVYVYHGVADIGIVGKDTLLEAGLPLYEMLDLKSAKCKLCVAGKKGAEQGVKKIATKYPRVTKLYYDEKGQDVEIIKLHGSIELAPVLGLSDVIVDVVESGRTLKDNGLFVLEEICDVSARLVINRVSLKTKSVQIAPLIRQMKEALEEF
jgi:ATP phosphoribosyltransferase regulatory subunit